MKSKSKRGTDASRKRFGSDCGLRNLGKKGAYCLRIIALTVSHTTSQSGIVQHGEAVLAVVGYKLIQVPMVSTRLNAAQSPFPSLRKRGSCARVLAFLVMCAAGSWPIQTFAQKQRAADGDQRQAAAAAYDRGTAAYLRDDYSRAAAWFETAHRLAPAAPALIQAVRAHHKADNMPRALTLALRLQGAYPDDERATTLAKELLSQHALAFTRVEVSCPECQVDLDGKLQDGTTFFIEPETQHEVSAIFPSGRASKQVSGTTAETLEVIFEAPPETDLPGDEAVTPIDLDHRERAQQSKLPPLAVYIGAGVTGAVAAAALASWIDATNKAEPYDDALDQGLAAGCASASSPPECGDLRREALDLLDTAESAETRTNVLLVGAAISAAATGVVAAFFTDWGSASEDRAQRGLTWGVATGGDGAFATVRGKF